jgi:hypothetical protein
MDDGRDKSLYRYGSLFFLRNGAFPISQINNGGCVGAWRMIGCFKSRATLNFPDWERCRV